MIIGMQASELLLLQADMVDLLNGPDACPITMTWESGVPDPIYPGRWVGSPTINTVEFRGILVFAKAYRTDTGHVYGGPSRRKFSEVPEADVAVIMPASIDMKGRVNVVFVTDLCSYHPVEHPAGDKSAYTVMYPAGQAMIQWVFAKVVK